VSDGTLIRRHRPIDEGHRSVGQVRTRVLELRGPGAPILCLHGYSDQAETWRPLMRRWQGGDHHVVAVDLPGFGRASDLQPGPVLPQLDGFVASLVRDLAREANQSVFIVGNSLGGFAALRAGANRELPIAGVIPISPAGFSHSRTIAWAGRYDVMAMLQRRGLPMPMTRAVTAMAFRRAACGGSRHADRDAIRAYAAQFRSRADLLRVFGSAAAVITELRECSGVPDVAVPVLLLWGDRDRLTLHRGARTVLDAIPHAELVTLSGHAHCPQLDAAPRVAELITDFVARHRSRRAPTD
jgi:pimeloyl-ACP methyl ester carboxylesterase